MDNPITFPCQTICHSLLLMSDLVSLLPELPYDDGMDGFYLLPFSPSANVHHCFSVLVRLCPVIVKPEQVTKYFHSCNAIGAVRNR